MIAALLLAAAAAQAVELFPSYERVLALERRGEDALVRTSGGSYRLKPDETWEPAYEAAAAAGEPRATPVAGRVELVSSSTAWRDGALYGTERGLLFVSSAAARRLGPPGMPDENVNCLAVGGGALWVGHFDRGLSRLEHGRWRRWGLEDGLPSEWIDDLAWDGRRLWGATEKGAFYVEDGRVALFDATPTAAVFASSGSVWLAQPGRVVVVRDGRPEIVPMPERHPQRLRADGATIWVAGLDGLYELRGGTVRRRGVLDGSLPGDWITALAPWRGGLLVGTYDAGLASLGAGLSKPGAWVNVGALAVDQELVAVGGREEGLHLYRDGAWMRLGAADGLPGEDVSALAFEGEWLWVGTRTGLARLKPRRFKPGS